MNPAMVIFKVQFFGNTLVQLYNYVHSKILHIEQACVYEVCKNLKNMFIGVLRTESGIVGPALFFQGEFIGLISFVVSKVRRVFPMVI